MVNDLAVLSCELVLDLLIQILAGAVILRLSCAVYNLFAGASGNHNGVTAARLPRHPLKSGADRGLYQGSGTISGVPMPDFDKAVGIVFLATLINAPGTFTIFKLLRVAGQASLANYNYFLPTACIALPMGILVLAGINTCILPTRFGKGLLVSLLSHLFAAILASVIALIVLA